MMIQRIRQPVFTADEGVSLYLQKQGLEPRAAVDKAKEVFGATRLDVTMGMHNLYQHYDGEISMAQLYYVASRRALSDIKIDLASYDSLVSLIQEIKGFVLAPQELKMLQLIAIENMRLMATIDPMRP